MNSHVLPTPAARPRPTPHATAVHEPAGSDASIRRELLWRLSTQPWWDARTANVFVDRGCVVLQGLRPPRAADRARARELARALPGVLDVRDARVARREWQGWA